jgi:predicted permease
MRGNVAHVGFPVILATLGQAGCGGRRRCMLIPLMSLIAVSMLERHRKQHARPGLLLLKVFGNPLVIASLLGLLLAAVGWRPWSWLERTLQVLADFALPAALLALGAQLEVRQWRGRWRSTMVAAALKQVVAPLLGLVGLHLLGVPDAEICVGVLLLATPTAVTTYPVAAELGGDTDLAGACILFTTATAFVVFAAWSLLLGL